MSVGAAGAVAAVTVTGSDHGDVADPTDTCTASDQSPAGSDTDVDDADEATVTAPDCHADPVQYDWAPAALVRRIAYAVCPATACHATATGSAESTPAVDGSVRTGVGTSGCVARCTVSVAPSVRTAPAAVAAATTPVVVRSATTYCATLKRDVSPSGTAGAVSIPTCTTSPAATSGDPGHTGRSACTRRSTVARTCTPE